MYILIYLRILKLYYHILDKGDGRSGIKIAPFKIETGDCETVIIIKLYYI